MVFSFPFGSYIVKSILMGAALDYSDVTLENLNKPHHFYVRHEYVVVKIYGKLDSSMKKVYWDMNLLENKREYEAEREKLGRTPIPYGTT